MKRYSIVTALILGLCLGSLFLLFSRSGALPIEVGMTAEEVEGVLGQISNTGTLHRQLHDDIRISHVFSPYGIGRMPITETLVRRYSVLGFCFLKRETEISFDRAGRVDNIDSRLVLNRRFEGNF
jgi:hypothetical protein